VYDDYALDQPDLAFVSRLPALETLVVATPLGRLPSSFGQRPPVSRPTVDFESLPRSLRSLEYVGAPVDDLRAKHPYGRPLAQLPLLDTLVYRADDELVSRMRTGSDVKWASLRALRHLTVRHLTVRNLTVRNYWRDAADLFPALESFRYTDLAAENALRRDEATRCMSSLREFRPDARPPPVHWLATQRLPGSCDVTCCCCDHTTACNGDGRRRK
jgi:hypothetical protein